MTSSAKLDADMGNSADSMIEAMGGVQGIQTLIEERQSMFVEFWEAYSSLLEQHPDKWVAWGKEGVVGVSDSQDSLLSEISSKNITANDVMVEFLDTDPKVRAIELRERNRFIDPRFEQPSMSWSARLP